MRRTASSGRRLRRLLPFAALGAVAALAVPATANADAGAAPTPPQYTSYANASGVGVPTSDIAGSAFLGNDGQFHWSNGVNPYDTNPDDATALTFTNTNMSTVASGRGTTTTENDVVTYYGNPGTVCYQLDKSAVDPIPSPQEDDHCDVIGVWVDSSGTWHALLNDEFQFDPWDTANKGAPATVAQKIATGNHNNRILLATSKDDGASWQYAGPALTNGWDDDGIITAATSPGANYPFGDSGCRLFVDYSTGYFYITYNVKIYAKPYSVTVASWTEMARAPISGGMASGTWEKWYDGSWSQPGIGGIDGNVNSIGGFDVAYDPTTGAVTWNGSGKNASASYQANNVPSDHLFTFSDGAGTTYTADTYHHTITNNATRAVMQAGSAGVSYTDPVTGQDMNLKPVADGYTNGVKTTTGGIYVTQTDPVSGASQTVDLMTNSPYYEDPASGLIYLPSQNNESAISYDAYSQTYRIVGYDGNVYETTDLGDPNSWKVVGLSPANSDGGYLTTLDNGSLTNQNVSGHSFLTISDLSGDVYGVTQASTDPTGLSAEKLPVDTTGAKVNSTTPYTVRIGGTVVTADGSSVTDGSSSDATSWNLVPVADSASPGSDSGFYRLVDAATGQDLQIAGSTDAAQRAVGATATVGAQLAAATPLTSSSLGTPGGSDQWYLQAVATGGSTSIADSTTYRLVNRNSGLALVDPAGSFTLAQQVQGDASQYVTLTPPEASTPTSGPTSTPTGTSTAPASGAASGPGSAAGGVGASTAMSAQQSALASTGSNVVFATAAGIVIVLLGGAALIAGLIRRRRFAAKR